MPGSLEVRVSITKLLLALVVVIVPLSVFGLFLTERSTRLVDRSVGTDYKTIAQIYSDEASQAIYDRLSGVAAIASDAMVVRAVSGKTAAASPAANSGMLENNTSQFLKQRKIADSRYLSIAVIDANGHTVAASQPGLRPDFSTDLLWQGAYGNGQGKIQISGIIDNEVAKAYYVDIAAPIQDPSSGGTLGVVTAAVSVSDILARFREGQIANGAKAELVSDDGTVISAPNLDVFSRVRSQGYDAVHDAIGVPKAGQAGWIRADFGHGPWLIAYAATTLKQHFPNLNWVVMVSQDEQQAAAPVIGLVHFALIMVVLGGFMLTLLCVYYFLHRSEEIGHIEEQPPYATPGRRAAAV